MFVSISGRRIYLRRVVDENADNLPVATQVTGLTRLRYGPNPPAVRRPNPAFEHGPRADLFELVTAERVLFNDDVNPVLPYKIQGRLGPRPRSSDDTIRQTFPSQTEIYRRILHCIPNHRAFRERVKHGGYFEHSRSAPFICSNAAH